MSTTGNYICLVNNNINKKCFRNIYAPLGAKFKITTYMYKAL